MICSSLYSPNSGHNSRYLVDVYSTTCLFILVHNLRLVDIKAVVQQRGHCCDSFWFPQFREYAAFHFILKTNSLHREEALISCVFVQLANQAEAVGPSVHKPVSVSLLLATDLHVEPLPAFPKCMPSDVRETRKECVQIHLRSSQLLKTKQTKHKA